MRAWLCVVLAGCSFSATSATSATGDGPGPTSAKRRVALTFRNGTRTVALDGFAARIALDPGTITYSATGADLRFFDSDDKTALAYEIEAWNPGGSSVVWVRVPRIDAASDTD